MRMVELDDTDLEIVGGGQAAAATAAKILEGAVPFTDRVAPGAASQFNAEVAQALGMLGQGP
jgi:hypothetical protein